MEFIDKDHKVSIELYELSNSDISIEQLKRRIKRLINEDPLFFDPYLILAEILIKENKFKKAKDILEEGFQKAMKRIVNKDGNWPKFMEWGWVENRHIIRVIDRWAMELWDEGKTEEALTIFRNLLKSNPEDNIGVRYSILAIRMNLNPSYEMQFQASLPGFLDAFKISKWFEENSKKFMEEFDWWWKEIEENAKQIYQLKISIKHIRPPIWRRILISNGSTFKDLHNAIQEFFNWGNYHLHEFNYFEKDFNGRRFRIMGLDIDGNVPPNLDYNAREDEIRLYDVFSIEQRLVNYVYDFGDNWEHSVKLEKIFPYKDDFQSPLCIEGKRATPPEDCGGPYGYERILKIKNNPKHPEYKETIEWLGGKFDPDQMRIQIKKMTPRQIEQKYGSNSEEKILKSTDEEEIGENLQINRRNFEKIFNLFLFEKSKKIKENSMKNYRNVINLLKSYLNRYGFNYLTDEENNLFDEKAKKKSKITFCTVFGSDFLDRFGLSEFLSYFVPYKVIGNKTTFKTIPRVLRSFIKWLNEKGWINKESYINELELIDDYKEDILNQLLDNYR